MKKIIYLLLISTFFFASCQKDDVLDKKPLDVISDDAVWSDQSLTNAVLTQAYAYSTVFNYEVVGYHQGWSGYSGWWDLYYSEQMAAFNYVLGMGDEATILTDFLFSGAILKGGITIGNGLLQWWENPYEIIRMMNTFIEKVSASTSFDKNFIKQRVAEARFLRAIHYFYMVKRYGGVPLITKTQSLDDPDLFPPRATEQAVYDFIVSEMDAISKDLPETYSSSDYGRPTKYAALALECRAALYAGSEAQFGTVQLNGVVGIPAASATTYYQKSYDVAKAIINSGKFALYNADADKVTNFRNIFLKEGTDNPEAIFVKQYGGAASNMDTGTGNTWGWDFANCPKNAWGNGNFLAPYLETAEEFENVDGTQGTIDRTAIQQGLWTMKQLWGKKDPRFFATFYTNGSVWKGDTIDWHNGLITPDGNILTGENDSYNGVPAKGSQIKGWQSGTGLGIMKYLDDNSDVSTTTVWESTRTDFIVFRYGEVLLNLAEAAFELGKTGEALDAVNQIRSRAGIATLGSVSREKIRHERYVELCMEGNRYWDIRRWRIAESKIPVNRSGIRYILDYNTRKYKMEIIPNIDGLATPIFYSYNYYLPIMTGRTAANHNLVENPGY